MAIAMNIGEALSVSIAGGVIALILAGVFTKQVLGKPRGQGEEGAAMNHVSEAVHKGAKAFLRTEYKFLAVFCFVVGIVVLAINPNPGSDGVFTMLAFWFGAILSGGAGYAGMVIATQANVRTTQACRESLKDGLKVAFRSGAVMSLTVVGLALLGLCIVLAGAWEEDNKWSIVAGFGFGGSAIALFARVGGGVFTKAADVGADLVGKVESDIPEDDPRNPATIADNVGDNVGDVAGMGADLFESFAGSLIAAGTLGWTNGGLIEYVALPFWIAGFGVIASLMGIFLVTASPLSNKAGLDQLLSTLRCGLYFSGFIITLLSAVTCFVLFEDPTSYKLFGCIIIGLVSGIVIGNFTEYCTAYEFMPTKSIADAGNSGHAPVVIQGLGVGMLSVIVPTLAIAVAVLACNGLAGLYGVALAAVGMLSTLGITLATDAYGPVADNAGGIAEMCLPDGVDEEGNAVENPIRVRTDNLDALGNTTAATGKGFAIGSAVLTSVGLIAAFMSSVGLDGVAVDLKEPVVLTGVLVGASLPFVFAALTMLSVGKSAQAIIKEVRRQFHLAPELLRDGAKSVTKGDETFPNHEACVDLCTTAAIQEMVLPGAMAIFAPAVVGGLLGSLGLAGMLGGSLTSGFMLALTMANAGGAWDNAKKLVEKEGGKGSDKHKAVVTGDTVGDPFKDTSGPALNILIKLMSIVSLVMAPTLKPMSDEDPKGFTDAGIVMAVVTFVVVGLVVYALLRKFAASNAKRDAAVEAVVGGKTLKKDEVVGGAAASTAEDAEAPAAATNGDEEKPAEAAAPAAEAEAAPAAAAADGDAAAAAADGADKPVDAAEVDTAVET